MAATSGGRKLRIVVLGLNYAPETTGIAPYTTGFARHLAAEAHDVTVISGHPHYPEWKLYPGYECPRSAEDDHGVRLLRVRHRIPQEPNGIARVWMELVFACRAAMRLMRLRPDVVVVVSPALLALLPTILLRPLLHYRIGVWVQDLYGAALAETGIGGSLVARATAWLERSMLGRADGVVVIHEVFRQNLVANGVLAERVEVIPNWAHVSMPDDFDRATIRRGFGWNDDEFIALHAGNMGAKQGLEGLVDVARLAEQRGSPVRIVLMGNGSRRKALLRYADGSDRLSILESRPAGHFEAALMAADCLLLHEKPGVVEMSVPSKLTTYFTAARPVVAATDPRSGAAALMSAARAGRVVAPGDPDAMLGAIEDLAADRDAAATYGLNGLSYAREHLTGGAALRRKLEWVAQLAGNDPHAHAHQGA